MTEEKPKITLFPFLQVGIGWLVVAASICWFASGSEELRWKALKWLALLWTLCMLDLLTLAKLMNAVLTLMSETARNQAEQAIRASSWGAAKLACLASLGFILYHGRVVIGSALMTGLGTMVIVPLAGGIWWYQKVLRHA